MSKKYKEAIDQITASDEIKAKIIAEMMQTAKNQPKIPHRSKRHYVQQYIGYAACFCLCVTAVLAGVPLRPNEDLPPVSAPSETASPTPNTPIAASAPPTTANAPDAAASTPMSDTRLIQPTIHPTAAAKSQGTAKSLPVPTSNNAGVSTQAPQRQPAPATLSPRRSDAQITQPTAPQQTPPSTPAPAENQAPVQAETESEKKVSPLPEPAGSMSSMVADSVPNATDSAQDSSYISSSGGGGGSNTLTSMKLSPIEQLKQQAGYEFKYPQYVPNQYTLTQAQLSETGTIEIDYESDTDKLTYRTERGANRLQSETDSGESKKINENSVTLSRSESGDRYYSAEWTDGDSYALNSSSGLSKDTITKIIENVDYPQDEPSASSDTESGEAME